MINIATRFTPRNGLGQFVETVITPAVSASVSAACSLVQQTARDYCPVDTGALRDSITIDPLDESGKTVIGRVGPHMDYAEYVEYGTGQRGDPAAPYGHRPDWPGMAAQPYMRPALDETRPAVLDLFQSNLTEVLAR